MKRLKDAFEKFLIEILNVFKKLDVATTTGGERNAVVFVEGDFSKIDLDKKKSTFFLESSSEGTFLRAREDKYSEIFLCAMR